MTLREAPPIQGRRQPHTSNKDGTQLNPSKGGAYQPPTKTSLSELHRSTSSGGSGLSNPNRGGHGAKRGQHAGVSQNGKERPEQKAEKQRGAAPQWQSTADAVAPTRTSLLSLRCQASEFLFVALGFWRERRTRHL